jgi:hypothetical protein
VLLFVGDDEVVHGAYYLGDGLCFEKSGQDFYEPYRIQKIHRLSAEWPNADLKIWRQKPV